MPAVHPANITFGAEYALDGSGTVINAFSGALEEIYWSKINTESWNTFVWNCPG